MTNDEYRELVEFLGVRFDRVDERFEGMEQRFDGVDERFEGIERRLTRVEVLGEENRGLIQTVAEGVTSFNRKIDELRSDLNARFHGELGARVGRLERPVDRLEEDAS